MKGSQNRKAPHEFTTQGQHMIDDISDHESLLLAAAKRLEDVDTAMVDAMALIKAQGARIERLEAALRLTRPYIEMHTLSPNGTMATVLAKIDAALAPEQEK